MKPQPSQVKVTTVWLEAEGTAEEVNEEGIWRLFHCINCRVPVIEYNGKVVSIAPGDQPYVPATRLECKGKTWRDNQPHDCGMVYVFMGTAYTQNPEQTQDDNQNVIN